MTLPLRKLVVACAAAAALVAAAAPQASAARTYCSPTGDLCYGALAKKAPVKLRITLAARYFTRYRLCVTGPRGPRECRRFGVRERGNGLWEGTVRWARHFPNRGDGRYRVRWFAQRRALGPAIAFRR